MDAVMQLICLPFEIIIPIWALWYIFHTDGFKSCPEDFEDDDFLKPR